MLCTHCGQWNPDTQPTVTPPKSPDAHYTASALIAELMDARGEAAKYKDLFNRMKTTYDELNALNSAMMRLEASKRVKA